MTAEVVIMNKSAVALAADSAATLVSAGTAKVFEGTNKLFTLIKDQPVGIMIYNNIDMAGVPWETIIKAYRARHSDEPLDHLEDYAEQFVAFLRDERDLFTAESQEYSFTLHVLGLLEHLVGAVIGQPRSAVGRLLDEALDAAERTLAGRPDGPYATPGYQRDVETRYGPIAYRQLDDFQDELPLSPTQRDRFYHLVLTSARAEDPLLYSGVVIAGFGTRDYFPRLAACHVHGVLADTPRVVRQPTRAITIENPGLIAAFAQRDVVDTVLTGISPSMQAQILGLLGRLESGFPHEAFERIADLLPPDDTARERVRAALVDVGTGIARDVRERIEENRADFYDQVQTTVAFLPKNDLAAMAESMVGITSLKRKVTHSEPQTVGGAIDVAVISKGEGLVWIKRKHYFPQHLNPNWSTLHAVR